MSDSKYAFVTGASSGIGREFALQLAERGYCVVGSARREGNLKKLMEELPGQGHSYVVADLASREDVQKLINKLQSRHFDLLINNAGFSTFEPFYQTTLAQQEKILSVNCGALVSLAHGFLGQAKPGDALINLASIVAYLPTPTQPMYSASKAFVASFSECLWEEHRPRDVYVMGLCPGITKTEFISTATDGEDDGGNLPKSMTQSVQEVVAEALTALDKRKRAIVVTGRANRIMMMLPRFLSRHRLLKMLAVAGDPERAL